VKSASHKNPFVRGLPFMTGSLLPAAMLDRILPGPIDTVNDKLIHASVYFGFFFSAARAFDRHGLHRTRRVWIRAFLWCVLIGVFIEFLQQFVPSRTAGILDALANAAGISAAFGVGFVIFKLRHRGRILKTQRII
jgi:VanZ family protein